jgi:alpha-beta hydrolase superfamily lysophospholipase
MSAASEEARVDEGAANTDAPEQGLLIAGDGLRLRTLAWRPAGEPRAALMLVHGFGEHIGRYGGVATALAAAGYAAYGLDHRTHGASEGWPRVYLTDAERVVDDLALLWARVRDAHPVLPLFLYGHSMGAYFALHFALRGPEGLAGVVTSGAPLTMDREIPLPLLWLARVIAAVAPTLPLVPLDLEAISRDPAVVAAFKADPLVHAGRIRVRMAARIGTTLEALRARAHELRPPLLILHGGTDHVVPPSGSEWLHAHAGSADKTLRLYPGLYHEIHNEPERAQVLGDVTAWLAARVGG